MLYPKNRVCSMQRTYVDLPDGLPLPLLREAGKESSIIRIHPQRLKLSVSYRFFLSHVLLNIGAFHRLLSRHLVGLTE